MTVQELINQLHKIEDKSKEIKCELIFNTYTPYLSIYVVCYI